MHTIYLHGLGQTADSWKPVLEKITLPGDNSCPDLVALLRGRETFSREALKSSAAAVLHRATKSAF